jgi:hypothetical protein
MRALEQLEWVVGYLYEIRKPKIARAIARNRRQILEHLREPWLACESPLRARSDRSVRKGACRPVGPDEHARLSGVVDELPDRRVGVGRREEPPRYESGFRAHGSNQQFHRLLRHAVARALTTAPSLAGVSPAAADILIRHGWRRKGRPGRCRENPWRARWIACKGGFRKPPPRPSNAAGPSRAHSARQL